MTSPWCMLGNKITALGRADLSKHTHMSRSGLLCVVLFPDGTTQNFTVSVSIRVYTDVLGWLDERICLSKP